MKLSWILFLFACRVACAAESPEKRLEALETKVKRQHEERAELTNRIFELERQVEDHKAARSLSLPEHHAKRMILPAGRKSNDDKRQAAGHDSKRQSTPQAAFHVYMGGSICYFIGNALSFNNKPLDIGGGFSHDNTIYDVPFAGIYVFTWTVTARPQSGKIVTELFVNNGAVGVLTSDSDGAVYQGTGVHPATGVVVVRVSASDHVSIRIKSANTNTCGGYVLSDDSIVRTTFSGWLLSNLPQ